MCTTTWLAQVLVAAPAEGLAERVRVVGEAPADVADEGLVGSEHEAHEHAGALTVDDELRVAVQAAHVRQDGLQARGQHEVVLSALALFVEQEVSHIEAGLVELVGRPRY